MSVNVIYFSPTGGTKRVMEILGSQFEDCNYYDVTMEEMEMNFNKEDVCIFGAPVYGGRIPQLALDRFSKIQGKAVRTVIVAVYGNRAFEDALLELKNTLMKNYFIIVAGVAAIAEHSIARTIAENRPNANDEAQLIGFIEDIKKKINSGIEANITGNYPYKERGNSVAIPMANDSCSDCGQCVESCPTKAIITPKETDTTKCIGCMRCVSVCPSKCRNLPQPMLDAVTAKLNMVCALPKENELFV